MKPAIKILILGFVILVLVFFAAYIFLALKGKSLIIARLEDLTHREVTIKSLDLKPSLSLEIRGLNIPGRAKIDYLSISPSILGLLTGKIALNEVKMIRPEFSFERGSARISKELENPSSDNPGHRPALRLVLKRLIIKEGRLNFIDYTAEQDSIIITIEDLYFYLDNLYLLPRSTIANFQIKGRIPWPGAAQYGEISASGWINLFKKDMQAHLEVKDIDGIYLYPYYSRWVDLQASRIREAKLQFRSDITGLNNDVEAKCHLELTDIVFRSREEAEEEDRAYKIATAVLDILRALDQGKISLNFTIRTKMDNPQFGFDNIRMAFEDKLAKGAQSDKVDPQDLMMLPANLLKGAIRGTTDITRTLIESTVEVGKTLKNAVIDPFKNNKKKEKKENE